MEKEFVQYKEALALKELGFDEPILAYFVNDIGIGVSFRISSEIPEDSPKISLYYIKTPLYQQAFKWFKSKYNLHSHLKAFFDFEGNMLYMYEILIVKEGRYNNDIAGDTFNTEEEAEIACLKKLIELAKNEG